MFQPVVLFISLRYSRARQGSAFTAFINRFAFIGIALGVMALVVVMSVMNGFEGQLKQRILGAVPQVTVTDAGASDVLSDWEAAQRGLRFPDKVTGSMPFVSSQGILQLSDTLSVASVQGIYPESGGIAPAIRDQLVAGDWQSLQSGRYHVIVGQRLAQMHDINVGDTLRVITAQGGVYTPFGLVPSQRRFVVSGLFSMGSEVDESVVFTHGNDLARLIRLPDGAVSGLQLFLEDAFAAPQVASTLRDNSDFNVSDWRQRYGQLFEAVGMEKRMMWLMLALIIAVAAFNTLSALVMVINDKRHDIAILQTLGLSPARIRTVFLLQGLYTGVLGSVTGMVLGVVVSLFLNDVLRLVGAHLLTVSDNGLPIIIDPLQVVAIAVTAILLTLAATLYPALQAAHVQPSEALRYD